MTKSCGMCRGILQLIGRLGGRDHYRCRACGLMWSGKVKKRRVSKYGEK